MISTFLLNDTINYQSKFETLDIIDETRIYKSCYDKLYYAICWAHKHKEDLIYLIVDIKGLKELNINQIQNTFRPLLAHNIFSIVVNSRHSDIVTINSELGIYHEAAEVYSFIISRPLYKTLLLLLERFKRKNFNLQSFISLIIPHNLIMLNPPYFTIKSRLKESRIIIITPFRNSQDYLKECIDTIINQKYVNFKLFIIDDASDTTKR